MILTVENNNFLNKKDKKNSEIKSNMDLINRTINVNFKFTNSIYSKGDIIKLMNNKNWDKLFHAYYINVAKSE